MCCRQPDLPPKAVAQSSQGLGCANSMFPSRHLKRAAARKERRGNRLNPSKGDQGGSQGTQGPFQTIFKWIQNSSRTTPNHPQKPRHHTPRHDTHLHSGHEVGKCAPRGAGDGRSGWASGVLFPGDSWGVVLGDFWAPELHEWPGTSCDSGFSVPPQR